jgi:CheY-like chemotaxis protein
MASIRRRILAVEDDPVNRALLRAVIERCHEPLVRDAELIEAPDVASAQAALAASPPDMVLLDVRLPDGNGLDLARSIRRERPGSRPWIIVLSASVLPAERADALAAGADDFLAKPYAAAALLERITRVLAEGSVGV